MKELVEELRKTGTGYDKADRVEEIARRMVLSGYDVSEEAAGVFARWCATLTGVISGPLPVSIPQLNAIFAAFAWEDVVYVPRLDALSKVEGNYEEAFEAVLAAVEAGMNGLVLPAKVERPDWRRFYLAAPLWGSAAELRRWAKKVPVLYRAPVRTDPPVDTEKPLNLGRWLFGMEGFRGHIAVVPQPERPLVEVVVSLPDGFAGRTAVKALVHTAAVRAGWRSAEEEVWRDSTTSGKK